MCGGQIKYPAHLASTQPKQRIACEIEISTGVTVLVLQSLDIIGGAAFHHKGKQSGGAKERMRMLTKANY